MSNAIKTAPMNLGNTITLRGEELEKFGQFIARMQRLFRWTSVQTIVESSTGSLMIVVNQARENQGQIQVRNLVTAYDAFVAGLMQAATVSVNVNDDVTGTLQQQMQELETYSKLLAQIDGPYAAMYGSITDVAKVAMNLIRDREFTTEDLQQLMRNIATIICVTNTQAARNCGISSINPIVGSATLNHGTQHRCFAALATAWERFADQYDLPIQSQVVAMARQFQTIAEAEAETAQDPQLQSVIKTSLKHVVTHVVTMVPLINQHTSSAFETNNHLGSVVRELASQMRTVAEAYGLEGFCLAAETMESMVQSRHIEKDVLVAVWLRFVSDISTTVTTIAGTSTPTSAQLKAVTDMPRLG